jgi:predicted heme/steroid binding protein
MKKKFLIIFFLILSPFFLVSTIYAREEVEEGRYTMEEVAEHNTPDDCWMVFENSVYDFSEYLPDHDRFMDIREWCGMDMTEDFRDKAGIGRDHRPGSYEMLEEYKIGELEADFVLEDVEVQILDMEEDAEIVSAPREYNILIPFLLTTVLYWGGYFILKKRGRAIQIFNGFWNTILLLTLLIPGMAFGIFMIVRTQRPELWDIDFDFMYWHVQLSLVMGFVAIYHFIQRFGQYKRQIVAKKTD